ncbi:hypothetical protein C8R43DRAFT_917384 [Mycena crocata]|nr:hypothetical protein C8R43DRAFT_917384 [Mycena crocata]
MDPSLMALVRSNDPPTDHQAEEIQRLIALKLPELSQLEDSISKLSLILSELRFQKRQRTDSVSTLRGVLSPIRRLPSEILGEIFLNLTNGDDGEDPITDFEKPPGLLGRVSSRWRAVSRNMPRLWNCPYLTADAFTTNSQAAFIREIFQRSQNLPLDVDLLSTYEDPNPTHGGCLDVVWEFHHRIEHFVIDIGSHIFPLPTLGFGRTWPLLASLNVHISDFGWQMDLVAFLDLFQYAPSLRDFTLRGTLPPTNILDSRISWSQLTTLEIDAPLDVAAACNIAASCTMLQKCYLYEIVPDNTLHLPRSTTTLHSLRRLKFKHGHSELEDSSEDFITPFTLPALTELSIVTSDWPASAFLDLHARSQFQLVYLKIDVTYLSPDTLLTFVRLLPTLQALSLAAHPMTSRIFALFTYIPGSQAVLALPRLEELVLDHDAADYPDDLNCGMLADMIESLHGCKGCPEAPFPAIRSVELRIDDSNFCRVNEDRLQPFIAGGFLVL